MFLVKVGSDFRFKEIEALTLCIIQSCPQFTKMQNKA